MVFPAQGTFVASSFKVQPVLTGKVGRHLSEARASLCLKSLLADQKGLNYAKIDWGWVEFLLTMEIGAKEPLDTNLSLKKINSGVRLGGESFKSQTLNLSTFYADWRQECIRQDVLKPPTTPQPCSACSLLWVTPVRAIFLKQIIESKIYRSAQAWWYFFSLSPNHVCSMGVYQKLLPTFNLISRRYFAQVESQAHESGKLPYAGCQTSFGFVESAC